VKRETYKLEAVAQDRGFPPLSRTVEVQIDVVDRANNPPVWDQVVYGPIFVKENKNVGDKVVSVKARSVFSLRSLSSLSLCLSILPVCLPKQNKTTTTICLAHSISARAIKTTIFYKKKMELIVRPRLSRMKSNNNNISSVRLCVCVHVLVRFCPRPLLVSVHSKCT
jgi:hypothetical protein